MVPAVRRPGQTDRRPDRRPDGRAVQSVSRPGRSQRRAVSTCRAFELAADVPVERVRRAASCCGGSMRRCRRRWRASPRCGRSPATSTRPSRCWATCGPSRPFALDKEPADGPRALRRGEVRAEPAAGPAAGRGGRVAGHGQLGRRARRTTRSRRSGTRTTTTSRTLKDRLAPPFDQGFSALVEDLAARGLLETTLVVVTGEFGRTPKIGQIAQNGMTEKTRPRPLAARLHRAAGRRRRARRPGLRRDQRHRRLRQGPARLAGRPVRHDPAPPGHRPYAPSTGTSFSRCDSSSAPAA